MDADDSRAGTWTEGGFGLSENVESPCPCLICVRGLSVDTDYPGLCVAVARVLRWKLRELLRGCCVAAA